MNFEQCEKRNKEVMLNAIEWAKNNECDTIYYEDMAIICTYLNMSVSKHFHNHFVHAKNNEVVRASGAFKTIYKNLDKIKEALLKFDMSTCFE